MAKRVKLQRTAFGSTAYFGQPNTSVEFIHSGSKMLDLALGGGWARRRVANIVGDKSSGKTLLAIEASANFARQEPRGRIRYREAEEAFDAPYAGAIGMPLDRVDFGDPLDTVEDFFADLTKVVEGAKPTQPELYILDSLDALSDEAELARGINEGSYGASKAKKLSEIFRRINATMSRADVTLIVISQLRDKIGVQFGAKQGRTGGRALDFYASQITWLAQLQQMRRKIKQVERVTGIEVGAKVKKNKVGLSFREATFPIRFGYGVDDLVSCIEWLDKIGHLTDFLGNDKETSMLKHLDTCPIEEYREQMARLHQIVTDHWYRIEREFLPTRSKYGDE